MAKVNGRRTSKSACYNAGRSDALAGRPSNPEGSVDKKKYKWGYNAAKKRMKNAVDTQKAKIRQCNPIATCVATGYRGREKSMGAYDWANDEFFVTPEAMDEYHGVTL